MGLSPGIRAAVYGIVAALFVTGIAWLALDRSIEATGSAAPLLLAAHGGLAMLSLFLLGALLPLHYGPAWQWRLSRAGGTVMLSIAAGLVATAFGLYYIGSDTWRGWAGDLHIALGLALPAVLADHVIRGRRLRRAADET